MVFTFRKELVSNYRLENNTLGSNPKNYQYKHRPTNMIKQLVLLNKETKRNIMKSETTPKRPFDIL